VIPNGRGLGSGEENRMKLRWLPAVLAALTLTLGATAAFAQDKGVQGDDAVQTKTESVHRSLERILGTVGATSAQMNQIFEIRQQYEHDRLQLKLAGGSKEELADRFKSLQDKAGRAMADVLSEVQIQKLHSGGGILSLLGAGGLSPWDFLRELDLSTEQRIHLKQIVARANTAMDAVNQDGSLSPQQAKIKVGELHHQAIAELAAILTPDQQRQLHRLLDEQEKGHKISP
jgi:Spy/CpxP family protein refolding chaperone